MSTSVPAGVYRHYKGDRQYLVLGLGHDANDPARTVVVYVPLYVDPRHGGPRLAVRTLADFAAWVDPASGRTVAADDQAATRRFTYLGDGG